MSIMIGIAGITGRMGRLLEAEVAAAAGLGVELAGGSSRPRPGHCASESGGVRMFGSMGELAAASDLVIDFTVAAAVRGNALALMEAGCAWVLGTTGLSGADEEWVAAAAEKIPVLAAANFSPGVTLLLTLAERLGAALPADVYDAEIIEMHHRQKVDAPSGTALALGRALASGRGVDLGDVMASVRAGHTGVRKDGEIGFVAVRGGQIVGRHTLLMTSAAEQIELTHDVFDRSVFAKGAVRGALWLMGRPAGLYSMRDVLGL